MSIKSTVKDEKGFSLIELAMVILIVGILTVPMVSAYNTYIAQQKEDVTEGRMREVRNAINKFALEQGRYPIPATFSAGPSNIGYGVEGTFAPLLCTDANWFTSGGMCLTPPPNEVLIGSVPFATIGLGPKDALDYWGNRFLYAVTLSQASAGSYVRGDGTFPFFGQIEVRALDNALAFPPGVMTTVMQAPNIEYRDMVLVSHGEDGAGAFTVDGNRTGINCDITLSEYQDENCNMDHIFVLDRHPSGTTADRPSTKSFVPGGTYFDDYTDQQIITSAGSWAPITMAGDAVWTGGSRIGVGTSDPQAKVHVNGDVTATGKIRADQMCDPDTAPAACFDPEIIAGAVSGMNCNLKSPFGGAVTDIAYSSVGCSGAVQSSGATATGANLPYYFEATHVQRVTCGGGQLMVGIDGAGAPICQVP